MVCEFFSHVIEDFLHIPIQIFHCILQTNYGQEIHRKN